MAKVAGLVLCFSLKATCTEMS